MSQVRITLPDGSNHSFEKGVTALMLLKIGAPANDTAAASVNDILVDAMFPIMKAPLSLHTGTSKIGHFCLVALRI